VEKHPLVTPCPRQSWATQRQGLGWGSERKQQEKALCTSGGGAVGGHCRVSGMSPRDYVLEVWFGYQELFLQGCGDPILFLFVSRAP
jgi:hypothetical protein